MSTNNFKYENVLVVLPDFNFYHESEGCDCEDKDEKGICKMQGDYVDFDKYAYDEYIGDMQSKLEKIGFSSCERWDNDRNYGGKIIAEWSIYDKNDNRKDIEVVVRSGYYNGANIDYTITEGDYDYTETNTMKNKIDSKIRRLEKILRKNGTEMLKVAQFSNGEAMYQLKK